MTKVSQLLQNHILIIHHVTSHLNRIEALINNIRKSNEGKISVVAFNNKSELEQKGINCKTPADYVSKENYARCERDGIAFTELLGGKWIDENTTLIKFLEYDNTSLWWFVEQGFYYHHLKSIVKNIESLEQILEKEKPEKVLIINDKSELAKLVSLIADKKGIPVQFISPNIYLGLKVMTKRLLIRLKPFILFSLRGVRLFLRESRARVSSPQPASKGITRRKILLTSEGREQEITGPFTGKKMREDVILSPIVRELEKDKVNYLLFLRNFPTPFRIRPLEGGKEGVVFKWRQSYFIPKIYRIAVNQKRILEEKWKQLAGNESFKQSLTYQGINLWDVCKDKFYHMFHYEFPALVRTIELSKRIVEVEKPDAVVIASETSHNNRGLIAACHKKNIPVVAVQFGIMAAGDLRFSKYRCQAYQLKGSPTKLSIIPDKLCVYGEDTRSILTQLGFPRDRIAITGQPRYDILANAGQIFDRERFCANWGINSTKAIVLIGAQTFLHHGASYWQYFYRSIFQALKNEPQVQIVIKPHPEEKEEWYKQLIEETGVKAIVLTRNSNTNEALYACDVLVTFSSTVALEAMIMGKPVVTVNLTGAPDPVPYAQKGAAIGVYQAEDIAPVVKAALENPEVRKGLEEGREKYLEEQFYKLDGQATKRVIDLIYKMSQSI